MKIDSNFVKKSVILVSIMAITGIVNAKVTTSAECVLFQDDEFVDIKPCKIVDYQTNGSAYAIDYLVQGYGKYESRGSFNDTTLNDESAIEQTRMRDGYEIVDDIDWASFSEEVHLSCVKQTDSGFEICS